MSKRPTSGSSDSFNAAREQKARKSLAARYANAFSLVERAVRAEAAGSLRVARELFGEAVEDFIDICTFEAHDDAKVELLQQKIEQLCERAERLSVGEEEHVGTQQAQEGMDDCVEDAGRQAAAEMGRADNMLRSLETKATFLLERAVTTDEKGDHKMALPIYLQAAEAHVEALTHAKSLDPRRKLLNTDNGILRTQAAVRQKLEKRLKSIIDRAEVLKQSQVTVGAVAARQNTPTSQLHQPRQQTHGAKGSEAEPLSREEVDVLRRSSHINGKVYLPWDDTDIYETFTYPEPFKDPDGRLPLSGKQKQHFGGWRRPAQFVRSIAEPVMIEQVSAATIKQDNVGDCSFVSSLCMAAAYERKFRRKLITNIIYPQNRRGEPMYNPSGKYIVRLFAGGIARKIVVDDEMPVDKSGRLLCACTTKPNELWVSVIEKAYMKLNGGYDFPGSTACIDMYALTGWLPESVKLVGSGHQAPSHEDSKKRAQIASVEGHADENRIWRRLHSASNYGDCLVSISTTHLTESQEEQYGLVSGHAYAVLRVVEIDGLRLLQVKNPWCRVRWKGRFSPQDRSSWTPKLQRVLAYNAKAALRNDNGIFWIDYASVRRFFGTMHMNWNPDLFFSHRTMHGSWKLSDEGPKSDRYCILYNPQYHLHIAAADDASVDTTRSSRKSLSVWLLLSRHQLIKEQDGDDTVPLMALHCYYSAGKCRKLFLKTSKCFVEGVYSNSPHRLIRFDLKHGREYDFTIVVSQVKKATDVNFTLQAFCSTAPITIRHIRNPFKGEISLTGEWIQGVNAVGCQNFKRYYENPQFLLTARSQVTGAVLLHAQRGLSVNVSVFQLSATTASGRPAFDTDSRSGRILRSKVEAYASSGDYQQSFCVCHLPKLRAGRYVVIVSTFHPNCPGAFRLQVKLHQQNVNTVTLASI